MNRPANTNKSGVRERARAITTITNNDNNKEEEKKKEWRRGRFKDSTPSPHNSESN